MKSILIGMLFLCSAVHGMDEIPATPNTVYDDTGLEITVEYRSYSKRRRARYVTLSWEDGGKSYAEEGLLSHDANRIREKKRLTLYYEDDGRLYFETTKRIKEIDESADVEQVEKPLPPEVPPPLRNDGSSSPDLLIQELFNSDKGDYDNTLIGPRPQRPAPPAGPPPEASKASGNALDMYILYVPYNSQFGVAQRLPPQQGSYEIHIVVTDKAKESGDLIEL